MGNKWFETVAVAQRRAKKRLPGSVYGALIGGSERGLTYRDNMDAFGELQFAPHVAGHKPERKLDTTVMGIPISLPVLISPTGVQAVHPDGEVAVARGCRESRHDHGAQLVRAASRSRRSLAANPQHVLPGVLERHARRDAAPARPGPSGRREGPDRDAGLVVLERARLGQPVDPREAHAAGRHAVRPQAVPRPAWLLDFPRPGGCPTSPRRTSRRRRRPPPTFFGAYGEWM